MTDRPAPESLAEERTDDPLVDYPATARRMRRSAIVIGTMVVVTWLVVGLVSGGPGLRDLPGFFLLGLVAMFVVEVWVVGGSAVRGMLRAGERGERLSSDDVAIIPPQLLRRRRPPTDGDQ